ncbi:chromosome segregation protein [Sphingopyxis sp. H038]|uniref:chromosome segregation protein SMC n=1 Tax=unclassified Sphingopyxis TaxID=2614943 RepID=UPI00072FC985|nr:MULTISPECIES: chromosome segregation protein SMC [unclassified Sphingopyxis]KTE03744.1 chromosome segregation protein [Sphingopyxis sp. H012]KTE09202.1 chromosome segregation protein [Sphingopyxis sp. H053]KTE14829.1 chromosome segregation protein [Sphingopyxis sp. H093]KTE29216.1 chromosome segregation protein [Sphingopyxis sp. H080]KTE35072.1 chromosome segregation protein [Sphingopyxis sp. H038]
MQIKRLRLTGFKSFVEPTELRIEPGLTGVVGPNGCGKSNLLEAIRWVMGESSPKSMRGGGMEDVIFAGTSTRPARDFAEVALHCDTEGALVAGLSDSSDGDDLEVIRRIERGAGSAYRANGRDVRAKDVALIFADAATGAHSPALVSQGKIANVIAAKPTDRRAMLEEAAGIAGLHVRRKDAEQKLRATETNLTRLSEIVADMEVRANALRRQARAAEKYKKLSDDIRIAEGRLIYARWRDAAAAADQARRDADAAETAVKTAQDELETISKAQTEVATRVAAARSDAQAQRGALAEATATQVRLHGEERAALQRLDDLAAQQRRIADDRAHEGELAREAHAALTALDAETRTLAQEIAGHDAGKAALADASLAAQARLRDAEVALAQARAKAASEAADRRIAVSARDSAETAVRRIAGDKTRVDAEVAALGDSAALAATLADSKKAAEAAEAAIATAENALHEAETDREATAADLAGIEAGLAEARAALAALEGEASTLERALAAARSDADRILDQLRVAPGYEAALAAALGDDLDAGTDKDAARSWGGADTAKGDPALPPGTKSLAEFVQAPAALARRLAQVAVTESDDDQSLAVGQRLVTIDGVMRRWDGFVTRGDGATAAERLQRQNRLDELAAQRPQVELGVQDLRDRRDAAAAKASELTAAAAAARKALAQADEARRAALRAADQAQGAIDRHRDAAALFDRRLAEIAEAANDAAEQLAVQESALAALPDDSIARAALEAEEHAADRARTDANAARDALAAHERTLASLSERQAVVSAEIKSWKARAGEAARRVTEMDKRADALAAEAAKLADVPAMLAEQRAAAEAQQADLREKVAAAEAQERAAEAALREAETALNAIRERVAAARETRAGAIARSENAELRRIEMGRLSGERFECPPPLLPQKAGFESGSVGDANAESAQHDRLVSDRERLGPVNLVAADELAELDTEREKNAAEIEELTQAVHRLRGSIGNLNREGRVRLLAAFEAVNQHFQRLFTTLFNGGQAHLELVDSDDPLEAGLEIMAQPPGKRLGTLTLLSGGEQALTAVALIFGLFLTNPAPICVLDEVDAPLDDANIERFCDLLDRMARETNTRYLIVTHNAVTMARMHRLFGVTMIERGVSRLVSVDLGGAEELLAAE